MVLHYKSMKSFRKAMAYEHMHPGVLSGRHQKVLIHGRVHRVKH